MKNKIKNNNKDSMTDVFSLYRIIENCDNFNNPLKPFLELVLNEVMKIEANRITGTDKKGEHSSKKINYRS